MNLVSFSEVLLKSVDFFLFLIRCIFFFSWNWRSDVSIYFVRTKYYICIYYTYIPIIFIMLLARFINLMWRRTWACDNLYWQQYSNRTDMCELICAWTKLVYSSHYDARYVLEMANYIGINMEREVCLESYVVLFLDNSD